MPLPEWPASVLPLPQVSGNERAPVDRSARSKLAAPGGHHVSSRERFRHQMAASQATWVMTHDQFAVFAAWWQHTLSQGVAWFSMPLHGETGIDVHAVRISDGYTADLIGGARWRVAAAIDIDNQPRLATGPPLVAP